MYFDDRIWIGELVLSRTEAEGLPAVLDTGPPTSVESAD